MVNLYPKLPLPGTWGPRLYPKLPLPGTWGPRLYPKLRGFAGQSGTPYPGVLHKVVLIKGLHNVAVRKRMKNKGAQKRR